MKHCNENLFRVCLISLWLILSHSLSAQDNYLKEMVPPTPNAAALGEFADIPVSHHTGVANISVPVYTVVEGELSLPISLNYHSSGIKVDEVASWVGLGWSLSAGGMISRTVIGAPDEGRMGGTGGASPRSPAAGSGFYKDYGIPQAMQDPACLNSPNYYLPPNNVCKDYFWDAANGFLDTEPDLFTYSFAGYSGKFFFDANRTPHSIPDNDIRIEPIDNPQFFYAWKLTTPDGRKYYFGGNNATENGYTDPNGLGYTTAYNRSNTVWYLYRIESQESSKWIELDYVSEKYSYANRLSHQLVFNANCGLVSGVPTAAPQTLMITKVDGVRLNKIRTSSGRTIVDFTPKSGKRTDLSSYAGGFQQLNTEAAALHKIKITQGNWCKEFVLHTSYFQSPMDLNYWPLYDNGLDNNAQNDPDTRRLKLNSIQEISCNGLSKPAYEFTYNMNHSIARRFSLARDAWGYYNGANGNKALIPSGVPKPCNNAPLFTGANREPDSTKMKAWMLEKMKFPTGAEKEFFYEAHRENNINPIVGGLRIKKIETDDGSNGPIVTRNFTYGTGILYTGSLSYESINPSSNSTAATNPMVTSLGRTLSSSFRPAMQNTQGYHIGYSWVDVDKGNNGKTRFEYYNTYPTPIASFPYPPTLQFVGNGELKRKTDYDSNQNIVLRIEYNYQIQDIGNPFTVYRVSKLNCVDNCNLNCGGDGYCEEFVMRTLYTRKVQRQRLVASIGTKDGVTTTSQFTYTPNTSPDKIHDNPVQVTITQSDGGVNITKNKYISDYDASLQPGIGSNITIQEMLDKNMKGFKLEQQFWEGPDTNNLYLKSGQITGFKDVRNVSDPHFMHILPTQQFILESKNPIAKGHFTPEEGFNSNVGTYGTFIPGYQIMGKDWYQERANYVYNNTGNLIEQKLIQGSPEAYIWGYDNLLPTARVENAKSDEVFYTSFESDNTGNWNVPGTPVSGGKTGKMGYLLNQGGVNKFNIPAGTYILSYWSNGNVFTSSGVPTIADGTETDSNGWTYHEKEVSATNSWNLAISGSGKIDELRLCPKDAVMSTFIFNERGELTETIDANNRQRIYEYDQLGRLRLIRDHKNNILERISYHYKN
jgi:YD repeat-containing protein